MGIKNFWSLNVDEAILSDKLKSVLGKRYQVFFPINSQLKDIDLIIYNLKSGKTKSIQVKGSRTYEPRKSELIKFGEGCSSWNVINKESIFNPTNQVDFFIFVLHYEDIKTANRKIVQEYLIIPIKEFRRLTCKKEVRGNGYHYFFWLKPNKREILDINNKANPEIKYTKYLNNFDLLKF